jgi:hypothetical protein
MAIVAPDARTLKKVALFQPGEGPFVFQNT